MSLADIVTDLDTFAKAAVADAVAEGKKFIQQEEAVVEGAAEQTATNAATDFKELITNLGADATNLVTAAKADASVPFLSEQQNLAAEQLIGAALTKGITLADNAATTLITTAEVAVDAAIAKL